MGYFSLIGAALVGPTGRVVATEPDPESAEAVQRNAALNGFDQVTVIAAAAGGRPGASDLVVVDDSSHSLLTTVGSHPRARRRRAVDTVTLDALVGEGVLPVPDVVKIDTEGSEISVLEGMRGVLTQARTTIICELHVTNEPFMDFMDEFDYEVSNLDAPTPIRSSGPNDHALARPKARAA